MKTIVRKVFLSSLSLWFTTLITTGLVVKDGILTFIVAGFVLYLLQRVLKPILQLVTLPINMLTLGLFSLVINAVTLFVLTLIVPQVKIVPFVFPGYNLAGFVFPRLSFNELGAFVVIALVLTVVKRTMEWLT